MLLLSFGFLAVFRMDLGSKARAEFRATEFRALGLKLDEPN